MIEVTTGLRRVYGSLLVCVRRKVTGSPTATESALGVLVRGASGAVRE